MSSIEPKRDPTERTSAEVLDLLKMMADQYPTSFKCAICGTTITQRRSTTQRDGWPVCCARTMNVKENKDELA